LRGSNDYLRLKRVKNDVMNNIISSAAYANDGKFGSGSGKNDSTGKVSYQQK